LMPHPGWEKTVAAATYGPRRNHPDEGPVSIGVVKPDALKRGLTWSQKNAQRVNSIQKSTVSHRRTKHNKKWQKSTNNKNGKKGFCFAVDDPNLDTVARNRRHPHLKKKKP